MELLIQKPKPEPETETETEPEAETETELEAEAQANRDFPLWLPGCRKLKYKIKKRGLSWRQEKERS